MLRTRVLRLLAQSAQRAYSSYFKSYEVPQYCTLNVKCPYNIQIKPLDQMVYLENNLIKIKVNSSDVNLQCKINYNDIVITDETKHVPEEYLCEIEVPVKANLYVDSLRNISIGEFSSEIIDLKSDRGDVYLQKANSDKVSMISNKGNVICGSLVQARDITLMTARGGCISTGRLQGINLKIETENGDIKVQSSYCDNSTYETQRGKIDLQNPHKSNQIIIHNEGNLNVFGLDGKIAAFVNKGNVDVQLSRIMEDSNITVNHGKVALKISEGVQDDAILEVLCKNFVIDNNISLLLKRDGDKYLMLPESEDKERLFKKIIVDCKNSNLTLETVNWSDMMKLLMSSTTR